MKTKTIREQLKVLKWQGTDKPEILMGTIEIERRFKVFKDGYGRLDTSFQERILKVNDEPVLYNWNKTTIDEFFPGWTSVEL